MSIASIAATRGSLNFRLATAATSCPYTGATLSAGASCTVHVQFAPTAVGPLSGQITLTDNSGGVTNSTQTISLSGAGLTGVASGLLACLNFGSQAVDSTSAAQTVRLSNTGSAALSITSVAISGNFAIKSNGCGSSLANGSSCIVSIVFTPQSTGALTDTLTITDNSKGVANSTQTVMLSGTVTSLATFVITPTPSRETVYRGRLAGFLPLKSTVSGAR